MLVAVDSELQQVAIAFSSLVKVAHTWRVTILYVLIWLFLFDTFLPWGFCAAGTDEMEGRRYALCSTKLLKTFGKNRSPLC